MNSNELWQNSVDSICCPLLTDEMVRQAEAILKIRLPSAYIELMKQRNGGYLKRDACPIQHKHYSGVGYVQVNSINGIPLVNDSEFGWPHYCGDGILMTPYMIKEWDLPEAIVLLDGDGHTWVALDYRKSGPQGEPLVIWIDAEMNQEFRLAANFAAFIEMLMPYEELQVDG